VHLEFDFTKSKKEMGEIILKLTRYFRVGLGGYVGTNLKIEAT
jgi:hypothetical protein